jgi:PKD repeat protein
MTNITNIIKLEIKINNIWTDYTDGMIQVGIVRGCQEYEYNFQQPESGICNITTRNPNLDPHVNDDIRMNLLVRITANNEAIFTGRLTKINVDYQPKGKPQITTLQVVDIIGDLALTAVTQQMDNSFNGASAYDLFQYINDNNIVPTFDSPYYEGSSFYTEMVNAPVLADGESILSLINKCAIGDGQFYYADRDNKIYLYNNINKNKDATHKIQFDSRGVATSYTDITLTDGFSTLINQLAISSSQITASIPLYQNNTSVNNWGPSKKDFSPYTFMLSNGVQNSESALYKDRIFSDSLYPSREIQAIKWDGSLNPTLAAEIDILDNVYIYHEVDPEDISRQYGIIGIEHLITANEWSIKYYLKNFFWADTTFLYPIIQSDIANPTIQDDITFSINNLDDLILDDAAYAWVYEAGTVPSTLIGTVAGTTQSITKNFTLAQTGVKNISCTVGNGYGYSRKSNILSLNVVGAAPTNTAFTYVVSAQDSSVYTFTATATEAQSYTFYFGDGSSRTTTTGTYTWRYSTAGSKTAYVVANNAYGTHQSASQTFTVTLPSGQGFSGNYPVRYVRLSCPAYNATAQGMSWPYFGNFRANNYLNVNRATNGAIVWAGQYELTPSEPDGVIGGWYRGDIRNNTFPILTSALLTTPYTGIVSTSTTNYITPYNNIVGHCEWSVIIDLQSEWYDINTLLLAVQQRPSTVNSGPAPDMNIYVTTELGALTDPTAWHWDKLGTFSKATGTFTAAAGVIMPPTLDPINTFSYTISNENIYNSNNVYSFTTSNWRTETFLWNFGDGNTSTEQNPVHIYSANGTYTVTCTKTSPFGDVVVVTQTITTNATFIEHGTMPVRYIKLEQPYYNAVDSAYETLTPAGGGGWTANFVFYSPAISRFKSQNSVGTNRLLNKAIYGGGQPSVGGYNWYPMQPTSKDIAGFLRVPNTVPSTYSRSMTHLSGAYTGVRPATRTMDLSAPVEKQSNWNITFDLGQNYYDLKNFYLSFNKTGTESFTYPLPTYNVYVADSDNTGTQWTLVGTITPPSLDSDVNTWQEVQMVPSITMPPNL